MGSQLAIQQDVIRAAMHLAELRLADRTQPPNVQQAWQQLSAACGEAAEIILVDTQRLACDQETADQQVADTPRQETPQRHRAGSSPVLPT